VALTQVKDGSPHHLLLNNVISWDTSISRTVRSLCGAVSFCVTKGYVCGDRCYGSLWRAQRHSDRSVLLMELRRRKRRGFVREDDRLQINDFRFHIPSQHSDRLGLEDWECCKSVQFLVDFGLHFPRRDYRFSNGPA